MNSTEIREMLTVVTALTGLGGAPTGISKYFRYPSRKDRMEAVVARFAIASERAAA